MNKVTTLNQFIIEQQAGVPQATGGFSCLLHHVGIAAKKVNREVNKAGLVDMLGRAGAENIQGEDQQKLDREIYFLYGPAGWFFEYRCQCFYRHHIFRVSP